jgi:hypothetical protein
VRASQSDGLPACTCLVGMMRVCKIACMQSLLVAWPGQAQAPNCGFFTNSVKLYFLQLQGCCICLRCVLALNAMALASKWHFLSESGTA